MQTEPTRLRDILAAGHPDDAIIGVTIGTLKAIVADQRNAGDLVAMRYVGTVQGAVA